MKASGRGASSSPKSVRRALPGGSPSPKSKTKRPKKWKDPRFGLSQTALFHMKYWLCDLVEMIAPGDGSRPPFVQLHHARLALESIRADVEAARRDVVRRGDMWTESEHPGSWASARFMADAMGTGRKDMRRQLRLWLWELCMNRLWHRHWHPMEVEVLRDPQDDTRVLWESFPTCEEVWRFIEDRWRKPDRKASTKEPVVLPQVFDNYLLNRKNSKDVDKPVVANGRSPFDIRWDALSKGVRSAYRDVAQWDAKRRWHDSQGLGLVWAAERLHPPALRKRPSKKPPLRKRGGTRALR